MSCLIKKVKIIDKNSSWNGQTVDLLIRKGKIEDIAKEIQIENIKTVSIEGLCASPGWLDIGVALTEPGHEDLDDLQSLQQSAIKGGFTGLAVFPNSRPVIDNKALVDALQQRSKEFVIDLLPVGAVTNGCLGKDLAEMFDMHSSGVVGFSEGKDSLQHGGVMLRALKYASMLDLSVINRPDDRTISEIGTVDEGIDAVNIGLPGMPVLAETLMLQRDIQLSEYTGGSLVAHTISTADSVRLVRQAKRDELKVKATVSWHNLVETSKVLKNFDPNHKVMPPLRNKSQKNALLKGILEGTIDCIVSNHTPVDLEDKRKAFSDASFGALGLEQMFGVLRTRLRETLELEILVDKLSNGPREVLGLDAQTIETGRECNLTLFQPDLKWVFTNSDIKSKCGNAPYLDTELTGKVKGIYNKGQLVLS